MNMKTNLRRMGVATLVAGALCASITSSRAQVSMAYLSAGGSITNGNLVFHNFANVTQNQADLTVNPSDIEVFNITSGGESGLRFQYGGWALSGADKHYDLSFNYQVSTLDGSIVIDDNSLAMIGSYDAKGWSHISETATTLGSGTLDTLGTYLNDATLGNHLIDANTFAVQSDLNIAKDFALDTTVGGALDNIAVSHFDQTFSVIPEPASAALIVLLGGGLMGLRRFRRWSNT